MIIFFCKAEKDSRRISILMRYPPVFLTQLDRNRSGKINMLLDVTTSVRFIYS